METDIDAAPRKDRSLPNCALNPHLKDKAAQQLWQAISKREVRKGKRCQRCKRGQTTIVGHHADYAQPLVVEWLCGSCHKLAHYELYRQSQQSQQPNGNGHK